MYPTALLGRLVTRNRQSQDLVRNGGSLNLLIDHIKASASMHVPVLLLKQSVSNFIMTHAGKITRPGCGRKDENPCQAHSGQRCKQSRAAYLWYAFRFSIIAAVPQRHIAIENCKNMCALASSCAVCTMPLQRHVALLPPAHPHCYQSFYQ